MTRTVHTVMLCMFLILHAYKLARRLAPLAKNALHSPSYNTCGNRFSV